MTPSKITLSGVMAEHARNKAHPGLVLPKVKDHLLKEFRPDDTRDPMVIHPSEMAKDDWCLLGTYRRILAGRWPPEKFDFVRENIFEEGNDIHAKWQGRMGAAGFPLWGDWVCQICDHRARGCLEPEPYVDLYGPLDECDYDGGHRWQYDEAHLDARDELLIIGHSDAAFDTSLVEIKSVGIGTVRKDAPDLLKKYQESKMTDMTGLWNAIRRPFNSHLKQGDIYLHLAHVLGLPYTQIVYLYECKWHQMAKEFVIKYDAVRSMKLIAKAQAVKYAVDNGIPPPCIKGSGCKQCNAFPTTRRTVAGTRADLAPPVRRRTTAAAPGA